jgi:hypothetical protein
MCRNGAAVRLGALGFSTHVRITLHCPVDREVLVGIGFALSFSDYHFSAQPSAGRNAKEPTMNVANFLERGHVRRMLLTVPFRNEYLYRTTEHLVLLVSEYPLGLSVDHDDTVFWVD